MVVCVVPCCCFSTVIELAVDEVVNNWDDDVVSIGVGASGSISQWAPF